jgi:YesN/AraC family two-component response regulator
VDEAADGREAVQLTQELKPDVVIMDITMRELGGRGESGRKENRRAV